jgi:hypothetical protein
MIEFTKRLPFGLLRLSGVDCLSSQIVCDNLNVLPGGGSRTLSL